MAKKQALGKGLGALLRDELKQVESITDKGAKKVIGNIGEININHIEENPFQPRTKFDEEAIQELSQSIKELGLIQPITVRKLGENSYQLISGERRLRASKLANLENIPAYIRIANDKESLEMALVENIQREDLDAIEVALSYQRLINECSLTQEDMSTRVGKKRSTITNYLRLLKLDPIIQTGVRNKFISMGHARALINIENIKDQLNIYEEIIKNQLSVRQTENIVKDFKNGKHINSINTKKENYLPENITKDIDAIKNILNTKIDIKRNSNGSGKLTINFKSDDDFQKIKNFFIK